uniref:Uncharacterized protein n=1 Tax=Megaselia scalaris TaxID=36166 RepID=T1GKT8_MEGSC
NYHQAQNTAFTPPPLQVQTHHLDIIKNTVSRSYGEEILVSEQIRNLALNNDKTVFIKEPEKRWRPAKKWTTEGISCSTQNSESISSINLFTNQIDPPESKRVSRI